MASANRWRRVLIVVAAVSLCGSLAMAAPAGNGDGDNSGNPLTNAAMPFGGGGAATGGGGFFNSGFQSSLMEGSLLGTPGLWSAQFAETLAPGQMSAGAYASRYTRNPGAMVFTDFDFGWTVGITNWLEFSFATTSGRRVRLASPFEVRTAPTSKVPAVIYNSNPLSPFSVGPVEWGPVDYDFGFTIGMLSQDRGAPIGLGLQVMEHLPYQQSFGAVNDSGVATGEPQFNSNLLLDKWLGNAGEIVANIGYQHTTPVDAGGKIFVPIRDEFTWSWGVEFPRQARIQVITELDGDVPFGAGPLPHVNYFGPTSPMDSTWGVRLNPTNWLGINAAYRLADAQPHANPSGFVFGLSFGPAPTPPPPPPAHNYPVPSAACRISDTSVLVGATVTVTAAVTPGTVTWSDQTTPVTINYTYTWTTSGGRLSPAQDHAGLDTTGLAPGMYTVTVNVASPGGQTATCNSQVEVRVPVHHPPTAACTATPGSTNPGGSIALQATGTSPDGARITGYSWQVSGGLTSKLDNANRATPHVDTTGINPGNYNATATVTDENGQSGTCSASFQVIAPPAAPAPQLINSLSFGPNATRVDNKAKAALDDFALLLERNPDARGVIVGYATSNERSGGRALAPAATTKLAQQRAVNAKAYLVEIDHVAADRIEVRYDTLTPGKVDLWEVPSPQAAPYNGPGQTFDEGGLKPAKPTPAPKAAGGQ